MEEIIIHTKLKSQIHITENNNLPAIKLIVTTTDPSIIKEIITNTFNKKPILIQPEFRDPIIALGALINKGIMARDKETGELIFL